MVSILSFIKLSVTHFPPLCKAITTSAAGSLVLTWAQPGRRRKRSGWWWACPTTTLQSAQPLPLAVWSEPSSSQHLRVSKLKAEDPQSPQSGNKQILSWMPEGRWSNREVWASEVKDDIKQPSQLTGKATQSNQEAFSPPCHSWRACWQLKERKSSVTASGSSWPCSVRRRSASSFLLWQRVHTRWRRARGGLSSPSPDVLLFCF